MIDPRHYLYDQSPVDPLSNEKISALQAMPGWYAFLGRKNGAGDLIFEEKPRGPFPAIPDFKEIERPGNPPMSLYSVASYKVDSEKVTYYGVTVYPRA